MVSDRFTPNYWWHLRGSVFHQFTLGLASVWNSESVFGCHLPSWRGAASGCLGGRNAGAISQIAYLVIGLTLFPIFAQGGGIDYLKQPQFGYLLGFIPGAWVCGFLAFQGSPKLESLAFSCTCGLLSIHLTGLSYLILTHALSWANTQALSLVQAAFKYSFYPIPGQLAVVCAVTVLAYCLRHLMFY